MGTRGPLPVSWSSETARGRNTFQPTETPEQEVQPPAWLADDAREFWAITAPRLVADGRLRTGTSASFAILCELAVDCIRLSREVSEEGTIIDGPRGSKTNPKVRLLRDSRRDFLQYSKAFGLDPASSARMPTATTEPAELDPLELYIRQRGP